MRCKGAKEEKFFFCRRCFFFFVREERAKTEYKFSLETQKTQLAKQQRGKRNAARSLSLSLSLPRLANMDEAKENADVTTVAASGKPSWPLPSPSTGGSGGVARRPQLCFPNSVFLGDAEKDDDDNDDETILIRHRRAVDLLAHMATTAAVRDLASALEHLAVSNTSEEARKAAERALDGKVVDDDDSRRASERHACAPFLELAPTNMPQFAVDACAKPCGRVSLRISLSL